jgi:hypothetical protein
MPGLGLILSARSCSSVLSWLHNTCCGLRGFKALHPNIDEASLFWIQALRSGGGGLVVSKRSATPPAFDKRRAGASPTAALESHRVGPKSNTTYGLETQTRSEMRLGVRNQNAKLLYGGCRVLASIRQ